VLPKVRSNGGFVERLDAQAEVVEIAPLDAGSRATGAPELAIDGHEINERAAGAKLQEADLVLPALDRASQRAAVEGQHPVQVDHAQDKVIDVKDADHGSRSFSRRTIRPLPPMSLGEILLLAQPEHNRQNRVARALRSPAVAGKMRVD
jgi:hypothetical protein